MLNGICVLYTSVLVSPPLLLFSHPLTSIHPVVFITYLYTKMNGEFMTPPSHVRDNSLSVSFTHTHFYVPTFLSTDYMQASEIMHMC